jgi:hypothetical protein
LSTYPEKIINHEILIDNIKYPGSEHYPQIDNIGVTGTDPGCSLFTIDTEGTDSKCLGHGGCVVR